MNEEINKPYPKGQPINTKSRMASICGWRLTIEFKTRHQCLKFINLWLTEHETLTEISYEDCDDDQHFITIKGGIWANNLKHLAELLILCDYNDGSNDEEIDS